MSRKVTIFTGQWADLPLETLCQKMQAAGYDGLELACWGDHFDVFKAAESTAYCDDKRALRLTATATAKQSANGLSHP